MPFDECSDEEEEAYIECSDEEAYIVCSDEEADDKAMTPPKTKTKRRRSAKLGTQSWARKKMMANNDISEKTTKMANEDTQLTKMIEDIIYEKMEMLRESNPKSEKLRDMLKKLWDKEAALMTERTALRKEYHDLIGSPSPRDIRNDVVVDLLRLFTEEAIASNSSNVARPSITELKKYVEQRTSSHTDQNIIDPFYWDQVSTATRAVLDSIVLCETATNTTVKYGIECKHCRRVTKDVFRRHPTSKQEVVGTLVDLNNHLASCIGRSNDDHDFTDWMKHVSPLQVNLIAPNVMKRLRD
jgi:hypothetical protein